MIQLTADVIVIGAGPAGICAALSAARLGSTVILAGNRPVLGGNSSSEIRVWTRGATGAGNLFAEELGVWGDLKMRNLYTNVLGNPVLWDEVLLDGILKEPSITLLLNTHITNTEIENGRLNAISGFQMNSEKEYRLSGKTFIDCTGDGTIAAMCGMEYMTGQESREEFDEEFAPEQRETGTLGSTIFYYIKRLEQAVKFVAPDYAYDQKQVESLLGKGGRIVSEKFSGCDYWWFEYGGTLDTIADAQHIGLELKKLVFGVWNYIKNSGKFNADNLTLEWVGNIPGKRESRRMKTDCVLTQKDISNGTIFEDGGFYGGWYLDFHPSEGIFTSEEFCSQIPVKVYDIPLRCLYNKSFENLFVAGRIIGTTHAAFASTRIMNTCALSGQAAGTLAHWCSENSLLTAAITAKDSQAVRQLLLKEDMFLLHCKNEDALDLARSARISATSVFNGECTEQTGSFSLRDGGFLVIPYQSGESVHLLVYAEEKTQLQADYSFSAMPSRMCFDKKQGELLAEIPPGSHWITLALPKTQAEGFIVLDFCGNPSLSIATTGYAPAGVLGGHPEQADYWYPCIRLSAVFYQPENIVNGYSRPYIHPNLWISGKEKSPALFLKWDKEQTVEEIRLYWNIDLSKELTSSRAAEWTDHHKFASRGEMPPQLVKSFEVYVQSEKEWRFLTSVEENWQRLSVLRLEQPVQATGLKFVFTSTYGAPSAEVFEIRVY